PVKLTADLSGLTADQKAMIPLLIKAAKVMDTLYWYQTYGDLDSLITSVDDKATRQFVKINYGPWNRLNSDTPFVEGVGPKPAGANFYPVDMTKAAFKKADLPNKAGLYSFIRRDKTGDLAVIPY